MFLKSGGHMTAQPQTMKRGGLVPTTAPGTNKASAESSSGGKCHNSERLDKVNVPF